MSKIYLVRHAESIANTQGIYQGQTYDTDLSLAGKIQAKALADYIKTQKIQKIICSPLKRTFYTALECAKVSKLPIKTETRLIETNHGDWEGRKKSWIVQNYADIYKTWVKNPSKTTFPNGESFDDTINRVNNYLLIQKWRENTLIVTHDNIVRIIISVFLNLPVDKIWTLDISPTSVNVFQTIGDNGSTRFEALNLNDVKHLEGVDSNTLAHAL